MLGARQRETVDKVPALNVTDGTEISTDRNTVYYHEKNCETQTGDMSPWPHKTRSEAIRDYKVFRQYQGKLEKLQFSHKS